MEGIQLPDWSFDSVVSMESKSGCFLESSCRCSRFEPICGIVESRVFAPIRPNRLSSQDRKRGCFGHLASACYIGTTIGSFCANADPVVDFQFSVHHARDLANRWDPNSPLHQLRKRFVFECPKSGDFGSSRIRDSFFGPTLCHDFGLFCGEAE